jgi:TatD DNase family protein
VREAGRGEPPAWASIGLHPHEASPASTGGRLAGRELAAVTVPWWPSGSAGWTTSTSTRRADAQRAAFAAQIALAHAHSLALVIHARDAWDDLFDVLAAEGVPERTILHCFTGGPDEVDRCLRAGMFVSFSGIITFKNASDVREAAARCPLDRLLVETDSPFLAPVPHRGRRVNEPVPAPGGRRGGRCCWFLSCCWALGRR